MAPLIPRMHVFEIDDQPWYVHSVLSTLAVTKIITFQVPDMVSWSYSGCLDTRLDHARSRYPERLASITCR